VDNIRWANQEFYMSKHQTVIDDIDIDRLWKKVVSGCDVPFDFEVSDSAIQKLNATLQKHRPAKCFAKNGDCPRLINCRLRKFVHSALKVATPAERSMLAHWIVEDWGRIWSRNPGMIDEWVNCLRNFSKNELRAFVQNRSIGRIASWSKILSYADPSEFAIFDARVSAALNRCFHLMKIEERFPKLPSRNEVIRRLAEKPPNPTLSYVNYLRLLKRIVIGGHAKSILEAEMTIFANCQKLLGVPCFKQKSGVTAHSCKKAELSKRRLA
jgi:hypothetical protein